MVSRDIILKGEQDIQSFVYTVNQFPYQVDISRDHYVIDGKSILGMLGLGFGHVMRMDIFAEQADDLLEQIEPFVKN